MNFDASLRNEMIGTKDVVATQRHVTSRYAKVTHMIRGRAFHAAQHFASSGAVAFWIFDPTFQTRVLRTFERLFPV